MIGYSNFKSISGFLMVALCAASFTSLEAVAARIDIIDGEGFEDPPYSTTFGSLSNGKLEGQLASLPYIPSVAPWLASGGTPTDDARIQSGTVASGTQALQVDRVAGTPANANRWGVPVSAQPNQRFLCVEWDMYVEDAAAGPGKFGPVFGIEANDNDGPIELLGSLFVDANTSEVLYQVSGGPFPGELSPTPNQDTVNLDAWNHFHLDFDFVLNEYTVLVNGTALHTEPFVDTPGNVHQFSEANISALLAAPLGSGFEVEDGTAYFDNYEVYTLDVKIPEPTTLTLAFFTLLLIWRLPRR